VSDEEYEDLVLDGLSLKHQNLENCTFVGCSFARADLTDARLNASLFRGCNLSSARAAGRNLFSTTFEQCKMLGLDFREGVNFTATTFKECILDYSVFRGVSLQKMAFECCSLIEADLSLTNLKEAPFVNCDLTRAEIREAEFFQNRSAGSHADGLGPEAGRPPGCHHHAPAVRGPDGRARRPGHGTVRRKRVPASLHEQKRR
jgi:uncharacterized protein YjbI with pentapeptide repeats